jgi:N-acetylneuraminic acid mutarotase
MATAYPQGINPFIFSDTLPLNSNDTSKTNLDNHVDALAFQDFTNDVTDPTTIVLTFVIFAYPNAANASATPPQVPIVEILTQPSGKPPAHFDAPGTQLRQTGTGTAAFSVPGGSVNYTYKSCGGGVYQVKFTRDDVPLNALQWQIRFVVNDGVTNAALQTGLTFNADTAGTQTPWVAVPGQATLSPAGPSPIDFAAALTAISLTGSAASGSSGPLAAGQTYVVLLPVGNYGTGPLTISDVSPTSITNGFSVQLLRTPLTIAPGSVDNVTLKTSFQAPLGGQSGSAATATAFTLACSDPLAASSGMMAHFNVISLYAYVQQHNIWTAKAPMLIGREALAFAAARNGRLYSVGGLGDNMFQISTVQEYDPASDSWTARAPMLDPTDLYMRSGLGLASAGNGKLYAVGGSALKRAMPVGIPVTVAVVEEYDPATDTWTNKTPMSKARSWLGLAAAPNGRIYAVGGSGGANAETALEEYDPATDTWTTKAPMPTGRAFLGFATASDGKLYAVGGDNSGALATVEQYNPATNTWTTKAPMPTARSGLGLASANNGKLYAVGGLSGLNSVVGPVLAIVEEYDPATDTWATRAPMLTPRHSLGLAAAGNGKLYAVGGASVGAQEYSAAVEEYAP